MQKRQLHEEPPIFDDISNKPIVQNVGNTTPPSTANWFQTNSTVIIICLGIIVVVLLMLVVWLFMRGRDVPDHSQGSAPPTPLPTPPPATTPPPAQPAQPPQQNSTSSSNVDTHAQLTQTTNVDDLRRRIEERKRAPEPAPSEVAREADEEMEALLAKANE